MTAVRTTPSAVGAGAAPPARFRDLLAAEWLRLWALRANRWAFPLTALVLVAIAANGAFADYRNWPDYPAGIREQTFVPTWAVRDAFPLPAGMVLLMVVGTLGALTVVNEYASGMIRTSLAAVPARRSFLAAKALVLTGVTAVFGVLVVAASFAVSQAILAGRDANVGLGDPEVLRSLASSAALAPVGALVGMALGVLLRHAAATVAGCALVLILGPSFLNENDPWTAAVKYAMPLNSWTNLSQIAPDWMPALPHTASHLHSWIVLGLWPVLAVGLALALVHRRDL
ncbi:ABC transporter permease [Streptomyces sp. NPDC004111]|uniref:ABC transporter permease n=1 Tax=Streptomyces sp. NPDC004111 TaxID=3364690 RepID=UPI003676C8B4